jgi:hypothetical protein
LSATNAPGTPAPDIPGSDASAPDTPEKGRVDWPAFLTCIAVVLLASVPLALFPEAGERLLTTGYDFIADRLGFLYAFAGFGVFVLLSWLAFGRYGKVKLGRDEDEVEYSDFSWTAMTRHPLASRRAHQKQRIGPRRTASFTGASPPGASTVCPRSRSPIPTTSSVSRICASARAATIS